MRRTLLGWQPCILIIIKTKLNTGKPFPLLTPVHFSAIPSRIQFDSEQFPSLAFNLFSALWLLTVGIFAEAPLSLLSPAVCQTKKPVPRWEFLSQRAAQRNQHCFKASRWVEFQPRLSQDTGLPPQNTVLHNSPGSNSTTLVAICSVCSAHFLKFRCFYFFCGFVLFMLIFGEKSFTRPGVFANRGGLRWSALSSKASTNNACLKGCARMDLGQGFIVGPFLNDLSGMASLKWPAGKRPLEWVV